FDEQAAAQRIEEPRANQRGLARSGGARDREEVVRRQAVHHVIDGALAAEEDVRLVAPERAQPRIGLVGKFCRRSGVDLLGDVHGTNAVLMRSGASSIANVVHPRKPIGIGALSSGGALTSASTRGALVRRGASLR